MIDARESWWPDRAYTVQLIDRAQRAAGSRNKLCKLTGIGRIRLLYVESGYRRVGDRTLPVRMSFAEQVIMEAVCQSSI